MEEAEKERIIVSEIEMPIEALGNRVSDERKAGLKRMSKPELQRLAQDLKGARTSRDAISMTVNAICASEDARQVAEDKKYEDFGITARTDMDI